MVINVHMVALHVYEISDTTQLQCYIYIQVALKMRLQSGPSISLLKTRECHHSPVPQGMLIQVMLNWKI